MKTPVAFALMFLNLSPSAPAQDPTRHEKAHKISIGGEGGWDFLEVDAVNRKLYVARATRVIVVDIETEKVVGEIVDTPGVHGVAFGPSSTEVSPATAATRPSPFSTSRP